MAEAGKGKQNGPNHKAGGSGSCSLPFTEPAAPSPREETHSVLVKLLQASLLMGTCSRFLPSTGEAVRRFPGELDPVPAPPWPLHHLPDSRQASCRQIYGQKQSRGLAEDSTEPFCSDGSGPPVT
uniref:Uncharacterized protein n=1 Tax=Pipistrellus kuhlii TaxID=59472 RepID=A0A7J7Y918_PIPKU|nr:hypothetical protein mPipKuh1_010275 [Pipistrellus kuhlii]